MAQETQPARIDLLRISHGGRIAPLAAARQVLSSGRVDRMANEAAFRLIQEDGYLRIVVSEAVTVEDLIQSYHDVAAATAERPQPRLWMLPDDVDRGAFSFEELSEIGSTGESLHVAGKAALVARSDYVFGLARQVTLIRRDDSDRFQVFRTEAEALAWLRSDGS